jgi:hypothetical protein
MISSSSRTSPGNPFIEPGSSTEQNTEQDGCNALCSASWTV